MLKYHAEYREGVRLDDGLPAIVRCVRSDDVELLRDGFERLSSESRCARFLSAKGYLTQADLLYLTASDGVDHFAIGAVRLDTEGREIGMGVGRFVRIAHEPEVAEPAVTVVDEYQGIGFGSALLARLIAAARERGIVRFRSDFLSTNTRVRAMLDDYADASSVSETAGIVNMEFDLPELRPEPPLRPGIRHMALYTTLARVAGGLLKHRPKKTSPSGTLPHPMALGTRSNPNIAWIENSLDGGSS
jgi:GNAT superfamily N-acetyltransferase